MSLLLMMQSDDSLVYIPSAQCVYLVLHTVAIHLLKCVYRLTIVPNILTFAPPMSITKKKEHLDTKNWGKNVFTHFEIKDLYVRHYVLIFRFDSSLSYSSIIIISEILNLRND